MPYPSKLVHILGCLAKEEAVYGTAVAVAAATDGQLLQYPDKNVGVIGEIGYEYDGDFGPSLSELGQVKRAAQSGRSFKVSLPMRAKGGAAAYSASVLPSIHRFLKSAGFTATLDAGIGTEKYTYAPTAAGTVPTSLTTEMYGRGEKWPVIGAVSELSIDFSSPAPPIWTFDMMGIMSALPTDAAVPAITYALTGVVPPLATSITLVFGNFTTNAVLLGGKFKMGRVIEEGARVALSAAGAHLGYVTGMRRPVLTLEIEATPLQGTPFTAAAGVDPYQLKETGQNFLASVQFGSTQYNRFKLVTPQAQVIDVRTGNRGPTATWEIDIAPYNTTPQAVDDFTIVFD